MVQKLKFILDLNSSYMAFNFNYSIITNHLLILSNYKKTKSFNHENLNSKFDKYLNLNYFIEKQITFKDTPNIKNLIGKNIYCYVVREKSYNIGFLYFSSKHLPINFKVSGLSTDIYDFNFNDKLHFKINSDLNKTKYLCKSSSDSDPYLIPRTLFYKSEIKDVSEDAKETLFPNVWKIHTKKVMIEKHNYFIGELTKYKVSNYKKKFFKELLNGAVIDPKIKNCLISQLFYLPDNKRMNNESHSIVLTQGGTGKSSILGIMGTNLDDVTKAGLFGYTDVKNNTWKSGLVSQTKFSLLVDETNEIINTGAKVLESLNKPLDNGSYTYGKANSQEINFGNQFIFLGNINDSFTFENFLNGLSNNTLTIGRRFSYIVYDENINFIQGGQRPKEKTKFINHFSECLSYIYLYLLEELKLNKLQNSKQYLKLSNYLKEWIKSQYKYIECENTLNFFKEYVKSITDRIPFLIIKLIIFENIDYILKHNIVDSKRFYLCSKFHDKTPIILKDIKDTIENIIKHTNNNKLKNFSNENFKIRFQLKNKYTTCLLNILYLNDKEFKDNKLCYPFKYGLKSEIRAIQLLFINCRKSPKSLNNLNGHLEEFGFKLIISKNIYTLVILNKSLSSEFHKNYKLSFDSPKSKIDLS